MTKQSKAKKRADKRMNKALPEVEDTEFGEERLVHKAIQRSYNQSGVTDELLANEEDEP